MICESTLYPCNSWEKLLQKLPLLHDCIEQMPPDEPNNSIAQGKKQVVYNTKSYNKTVVTNITINAILLFMLM